MGAFPKEGDKKQAGLEAIRRTVADFEVDIILVIEDGFLSSSLQKDLPNDVKVIRLPKSSGAVSFSSEQWMRLRDLRVSAYFHGENPQRRLHPHQIKLNADEVSYIC